MSEREEVLTSFAALREQHHLRPRPNHERRLIFVTNRGPIEHGFGPQGEPVVERGAGGVVSGLLCAAHDRPVSWISLAMTAADRAVARQNPAGIEAPAGLTQVLSRLVAIPEDAYRRHYDGFSNRVLWFVLHGMAPSRRPAESTMRANWERGYAVANAAVAEATVRELRRQGEQTPVMFHDYQIMLAPALVRERLPQARLQHFIHTPWPAPAAWEHVPEDIVRALHYALAANDVIGLQTPRDVAHFLSGIARYCPDVRVDYAGRELFWNGRKIRVHDYPIALTADVVVARSREPEARAQAAAVLDTLPRDADHKLIMRVDRVEPTKNIVAGFRAYERLLRAHPELRGGVTFVAVLVPSREGLRQYRDYAARVTRAVERINARFGTPDWTPVVVVAGNSHQRALACMRHFDVLLVNPLIDGMNLVAKEGAVVNRKRGVIVLSREAGAYAQLRHGVLGVNPTDIAMTSDVLYRALSMPEHERATLAGRLRAALGEESAGGWLSAQLADLGRMRGVLIAPVASPERAGDVATKVEAASDAAHIAAQIAQTQGALFREAHGLAAATPLAMAASDPIAGAGIRGGQRLAPPPGW
ncbi:MAG: trehalose-6-phosphate synthase [Ktedonobacterales bacterium]